MATNYPYVVPGQPVAYSARRENDISALLNSMNGTISETYRGGFGAYGKIKVYNESSEILTPGTPIKIRSGEVIDDAVPIERYSGTSEGWGVLTDTLSPTEFGSAVISGQVEVEVSGGEGPFVFPSKDGKSFKFSQEGAPVLCRTEKGAVIRLGGVAQKAKVTYEGMFSVQDASDGGNLKVKVSGGQTDIGNVGEKTISIPDGLTTIYLMAEYIDKKYVLTLTTDPSKDKNEKTKNYATWVIASVEKRSNNDGSKYLYIRQEWWGGAIYFGSRYWI